MMDMDESLDVLQSVDGLLLPSSLQTQQAEESQQELDGGPTPLHSAQKRAFEAGEGPFLFLASLVSLNELATPAVDLGPEPVKMGRFKPCHHLIRSSLVSKHHLTVHPMKDEQGQVVDYRFKNHSLHGTFLNGRRNDGTTLRHGDLLCVQMSSADQKVPFIGFEYVVLGEESPDDGVVPEEILSVYYVGKVIGRSHESVVRYVVRRSDGREFALKSIDMSMVESKAIKRGLIATEVRVMTELRHPHVCDLRFYVDTVDFHHMVLDYAPKKDLCVLIPQWGLTEDDTRVIACQLCDALSYMHSAGVVHRDLKPENILIRSVEPLYVLVSDFGMCATEGAVDQVGYVGGTPAFLPPELMKKLLHRMGDCQPASSHDMWSLGVTVVYALCGRMPWDGEVEDMLPVVETFDVAQDIPREEPLSSDALSFLSSLLDPNPSTRMSAAEALKHPWLASVERPRAQRQIFCSPAPKRDRESEERRTPPKRMPLATE